VLRGSDGALLGLAVFGVPVSYVLLIGAFLVCALHMAFMIVDARHADDTNKKNDHTPHGGITRRGPDAELRREDPVLRRRWK
jgi:hypothetical protein